VYQAQIEKLQLERELELLKYANTTKDTLDNIKAKLSADAMKLAVTKELASMKATSDQLPKPVVEPPQKAQTGESFQQ
jgi:DNA-directed RNA polymerase alpha subunit